MLQIFPEIFDCRNSVSVCGGWVAAGLTLWFAVAVLFLRTQLPSPGHSFLLAFCSMGASWKCFSWGCLPCVKASFSVAQGWMETGRLPELTEEGHLLSPLTHSVITPLPKCGLGSEQLRRIGENCRNTPSLPPSHVRSALLSYVVLSNMPTFKMKLMPVLEGKRWEMWGSRRFLQWAVCDFWQD